MQSQRIHKGKTDNFALVDKTKTDDTLIYKIKGITNNIYTVTILASGIKCNCPDHVHRVKTKYNDFLCKHCCYILFNINQINSDHVYDSTSGKIQLDKINFQTLIDNFEKLSVNQSYNKIYQNIMSLISSKGSKEKRTLSSDECLFCLGDLDENGNNIIQCDNCGYAVHKNCYDSWIEQHPSRRNNCEYCKSKIRQKKQMTLADLDE